MSPYTREEWERDPSEGRGNATRMRLTIDELFAQRDEALATLREFADAVQAFDLSFASVGAEQEAEDALSNARAVLAKYPEAT